MNELWLKDPAVWRQLPLTEKMEAMRKWYCTGPCGQCASTMAARMALSQVLKEAEAIANKQVAVSPRPIDEGMGTLTSSEQPRNEHSHGGKHAAPWQR